MRLAGLAFAVALVAATGCSRDGTPEAQPTTTTVTTPSPPSTSGPAAPDPAIVQGEATLDGKPFDSRWVGAVVMRDGLVTPCQYSLPPVENGRYSVRVYADSASAGCGAPDSKIVLWTFANGKILFSSEGVPWPGTGRSATFAARYSTSDPDGAAPVTAQFNGPVYAPDLNPLPPATKVEAFVGSTRCGVASVRKTTEFTGYVLAVVGPDAIPGCTRGAPLEFRINGEPATKTTAVNTPPGRDEALPLFQQ